MKLKLWILAAAAYALGSTASAEYREGFYDSLDGKDWIELKSAAKEVVANHQRLVYSNLPNHWVFTDVYPDLYKNPNGDDCKRFWDMYSDNLYLIYPGQAGTTAFSKNSMQREHSIPKSWWKVGSDVEYTPAYTDLWNLYPSDGPANQAKSNYPFGITKSASFDNGVTKVGTPAEGTGGGAGKVFEPADEYKGDFARSIFYMATVYDNLKWVALSYNMFEQNEWPTLKQWAVTMLLDWARKDPVSEKEIARNDAVEVQQGNRNPFIDFPELCEYVWGSRVGEKFYIAEQGGKTPTDPDDTWVEGIEADDVALIGVIDGGIGVIATPGVSNIRIFDVSGRLLQLIPFASEGECIMLPRGIYVVTCDGASAPMKIFVR